jgi:stage V sporulation protein G
MSDDTPWGSAQKSSDEDEEDPSQETDQTQSDDEEDNGDGTPWGSASTSSDSPTSTSTSDSSMASSNERTSYPTGDRVVTEVSVKPYQSGALQAFVDIKLFGHFVMKGFKVMDGKNGLWVAMPDEKDDHTGDYEDVFFPITSDAREKIFDLVLDAYEKKQDGTEPEMEEQEPTSLGPKPEISSTTSSSTPSTSSSSSKEPSAPTSTSTSSQDLPAWKRWILNIIGVDID